MYAYTYIRDKIVTYCWPFSSQNCSTRGLYCIANYPHKCHLSTRDDI